MGYIKGNIKIMKTDVFNRICDIAETPSAEILLANLKEEFGLKDGEKLILNGAFIHSGNRQDIDVIVDDQEHSYPVQLHDGAMSYFSPNSARWFPANMDYLKVYKVNFDWLLNAIMSVFGIESMTPSCILYEKIWFIGSALLKKRKTPILVVRNITKQEVLEKLDSYLKEKHKSTPVLILTTGKNIPAYFKPYGQSRVVLMKDAVDLENEKLTFNKQYLSDKMGGQVEKEGFSNGFRVAYIDGVYYEFTKGQAEIIEVLHNTGKPIHKHEIMADTSLKQDDPKGAFRSKGKYHPAWNVIIKNDNKGNYWLKY
jgi:hypothetical protein